MTSPHTDDVTRSHGIDGGYGWLVVICSFLLYVCAAAPFMSLGMYASYVYHNYLHGHYLILTTITLVNETAHASKTPHVVSVQSNSFLGIV